MQQNLEIRFITTEKAKEWLTGQLQDLKGKVERADEDLQIFGSKHDIISLEEKENVTMQPHRAQRGPDQGRIRPHRQGGNL
jgi:uncharacterized protein involved in exopolysaccharide biosynthesis